MVPDGKAVLNALAVAAYMTDGEGRLVSYNDAAAELWGRRPEVGVERWCGSWKLFHVDGSPMKLDECPMAIALKEGWEPRGVEAIAERPDGSRVRILSLPTLLRDDANAVTGAINVILEVEDLRKAEADSARLAAIVTSSDDAIISKTLDGHIASWNSGAARIFGYEEEEMIGRNISTIIPPELLYEETEILRRLRAGERIEHFETVRVTKDGRRIDISLTVSPVRDRAGNVIGASNVSRDISARKDTDRLQKLLVGELHHRVRNTLATVQAVATQSLRHSRNSAAFVTSFSGRLGSLSKAHGLLSDRLWEGADLRTLVRDQVLLGAADDARANATGPPVMLSAQLALHLALVLHELGTNARKHGALASSTGRLDVEWTVDREGELVITWIESNGGPVRAPTRRGFGVRLIEDSLHAYGGTVALGFAKSGLIARITVRLPRAEGGTDARLQAALALNQ